MAMFVYIFHVFNDHYSHRLLFNCLNFISSFSDFVPIDLDEWWAQRFLANIDKLS